MNEDYENGTLSSIFGVWTSTWDAQAERQHQTAAALTSLPSRTTTVSSTAFGLEREDSGSSV
jgi:hypothetical protein